MENYLDPKYFPKDIKIDLLDKYQKEIERNGLLLQKIIDNLHRAVSGSFGGMDEILDDLNSVLGSLHSRFIYQERLIFKYDKRDNITDEIFKEVVEKLFTYIQGPIFTVRYIAELNNILDEDEPGSNFRAILHHDEDKMGFFIILKKFC